MLGLTNILGNNLNERNYSVVGSLIQPENPRENTIWVQTLDQITGHIFSSSEPQNYSEGLVWIKTDFGSGCPFSIVKQNEILVYPVAIYQYTTSAFRKKEAQIYQNGWSDISYAIHWLIKNGKVVDSTNYDKTFLRLDSSSNPTRELEELGAGDNKYYLLSVPAASNTYTTGFFNLSSFSAYSRIVFDGAAKGYHNTSNHTPYLGHINTAKSGRNPSTFYDSIKLTNATSHTEEYNPTRGEYVGIANLANYPQVGFQIAGSTADNGYRGDIRIYNFYLTKEPIDIGSNTWQKIGEST